jgi:hypothetical protein
MSLLPFVPPDIYKIPDTRTYKKEKENDHGEHTCFVCGSVGSRGLRVSGTNHKKREEPEKNFSHNIAPGCLFASLRLITTKARLSQEKIHLEPEPNLSVEPS